MTPHELLARMRAEPRVPLVPKRRVEDNSLLGALTNDDPAVTRELHHKRMRAVKHILSMISVDEQGCWIYSGHLEAKTRALPRHNWPIMVDGIVKAKNNASVCRIIAQHFFPGLTEPKKYIRKCMVGACVNPQHLTNAMGHPSNKAILTDEDARLLIKFRAIDGMLIEDLAEFFHTNESVILNVIHAHAHAAATKELREMYADVLYAKRHGNSSATAA